MIGSLLDMKKNILPMNFRVHLKNITNFQFYKILIPVEKIYMHLIKSCLVS